MLVRTPFKYGYGNIILDKRDISQNLININGVDYFAEYINKTNYRNKGANSYVFALYLAQSYETDPTPVKAIKISNKMDYNDGADKLSNQRFYREIDILTECSKRNLSNVISIHDNGQIWCKSTNTKGAETRVFFPFYVMDYASSDLKNYLENNNISFAERIDLCLQIATGVNELYHLGYYHRDLKPDNILLFGNTWKIGDLGLVAFRDDDYDRMNEFIGPKGWITPEAMNKYLSEGNTGKAFDCKIDHQSDIFQLGKVFWYIIQGNAPIGTVKRRDYIDRNDEIYALLKFMLNHAKEKRPKSMEIVIKTLNRIAEKYY